METYVTHRVIHWDKELYTSSNHKLIGEEPLSIRVQGKPYSVVMRTPGDELAHAAGFCLARRIIDTPDDIKNISCCDGTDSTSSPLLLKNRVRAK